MVSYEIGPKAGTLLFSEGRPAADIAGLWDENSDRSLRDDEEADLEDHLRAPGGNGRLAALLPRRRADDERGRVRRRSAHERLVGHLRHRIDGRVRLGRGLGDRDRPGGRAGIRKWSS